MNPQSEAAQSRRTATYFMLVVVLLMFIVSGWAWPKIPSGARVPIHWNAAGEPNNFAGKTAALIGLPLGALLLAPLLAALPRIDPRGHNIVRSGAVFGLLLIVIYALFLVAHTVAILSALGREVDAGVWIGGGVGVMFLLLGNYMGKIRQNYTVGIKTPWTLASRRSWDKTHRLGGKLFMAVGVLISISALFGGGAVAALVPFSVIGVIVVLFAYSYWMWRTDPARGRPTESGDEA